MAIGQIIKNTVIYLYLYHIYSSVAIPEFNTIALFFIFMHYKYKIYEALKN